MFENFKKSNLCGARVVLVMGDWLLGGVCGGACCSRVAVALRSEIEVEIERLKNGKS